MALRIKVFWFNNTKSNPTNHSQYLEIIFSILSFLLLSLSQASISTFDIYHLISLLNIAKRFLLFYLQFLFFLSSLHLKLYSLIWLIYFYQGMDIKMYLFEFFKSLKLLWNSICFLFVWILVSIFVISPLNS